VPTLETIILTTLLCAARLFEVTACVYTSSVIRLFACRKSSCTVLMSSPFAFSNVPNVGGHQETSFIGHLPV